MLIEIDRVKVNDRIRKDFGNIEELATDIKENGLINPPVVTPEYELIAGERRLRALKHLGYQQIEVRVMSVNDEEHKLNLEINENEVRKDFSKLERLDYARRLERIERIKSEKRQSELNGKSQLGKNFSLAEQGKTRDIVAEKLGIGSGIQYEKEKYVAENGNQELISAWDKGDISTHKAYVQIKQEKENAENQIKNLQNQIQQEKNKPPKIVEKIVEKVIDNTDYNKMKEFEIIKRDLEYKTRAYDLIKEKEDNYTLLMEKYKNDSDEYTKLKREMDLLVKQKSDLSRSLDTATELSGLVYSIEGFIKRELAPIKYSRSLIDMSQNDIVQENLSNIVKVVQNWCDEMNEYLVDKNYINVEEN